MDTGVAVLICSLIALGLFYGGYFFLKHRNKKALATAINKGQGVLWTWQYAPNEWKYAAETHFDIQTKRMMETGKVCFTEKHIYVSNGRDEILFELIGDNKYEKHLTEVFHYKGSAMQSVRFEVRSKEIKKEEGRETMEETYENDSLTVPIPKAFESESAKIITYYQDILNKNPDAVAAVSPYGLGLFGN